jgi:hypothetical protein
LQIWHFEKYKPQQSVAFADRTIGDLLEEYYLGVAIEVERLQQQSGDLSPDQLERLSDLEDLLRPKTLERTSLRGLSDAEKEEVLGTAHKTGDDLADYWEYRAAKGLPVDLGRMEVPPRSEWDEEDA